MAPPRALHLLLAAGPGAPGAAALLARAAAEAGAGRALRILLSGEGLSWAGDARLEASGAVEVAVCSRNARDAGWTLETAPAGIRWSSVAAWPLALSGSHGILWAALP